MHFSLSRHLASVLPPLTRLISRPIAHSSLSRRLSSSDFSAHEADKPIAEPSQLQTSHPRSTQKSPRNLDYKSPTRKDPKFNWNATKDPVCELVIAGYVLPQVIFFAQFAQRTIQALNLPLRGPIAIVPHVRRWTVLTSPFKYKRAQESFQRKTFRRKLVIYAASNDAVDKFVHYLSHVAPAAVGLQVTRYERDDLSAGNRMQMVTNAILAKGGNIQLPFNADPPKNNFYKAINEYAKGLAATKNVKSDLLSKE